MHNNDSLERVTRLMERSAPVLAATVGLDGRPQLRPVSFLLSAESVTGAVLPVDSGQSLLDML